jgi:hypothetical protein
MWQVVAAGQFMTKRSQNKIGKTRKMTFNIDLKRSIQC